MSRRRRSGTQTSLTGWLATRILNLPEWVTTGSAATRTMEAPMGRGILLWLIGVPIPVIIILALVWH